MRCLKSPKGYGVSVVPGPGLGPVLVGLTKRANGER